MTGSECLTEEKIYFSLLEVELLQLYTLDVESRHAVVFNSRSLAPEHRPVLGPC